MAGPRRIRLGGAFCLLTPVMLGIGVPAVGPPVVDGPTVGLPAVGLPVVHGPTVNLSVDGLDVPLPTSSVLRAACTAWSALLDPPEYYGFPLVSTRRVPGTGRATGVGLITFVPSPFGVALAPDGSYVYDLILTSERLAEPREGAYIVWVTTPSLDRVRLVGALDERGGIQGRVRWNKFLVVVTLEPRFDPEATMWSGPIVMRGMSRSGMMHTMAGHGPFETDNCAQYGY